ncbi:hypothetical protein P7K49_033510 [Saguinus oedipus]|uniref:DUF7819 domain-containing protein n=1 Tax=Saguinus oedipus TaxID=9490 RepID=A0ABQ9TS40_SAGOE|nr:hypothetical protein P7K49_033510 [Saguinus oedipus]
MGPPHHHPGHRMPHPGINEHPPWAGPQHPDFGPPPHGFNGQPPHMRRQGPPHINHDDPSLVPNVPYFDLPAGLMAPLVKALGSHLVPGLLEGMSQEEPPVSCGCQAYREGVALE